MTTTPTALFSHGFRPFFLAGGLQAAAAVALWVPAWLGLATLPGHLPPAAWHSHELLFGYVPAVVAGFLCTAVANWTGRPPVAGGPLALLFALWVAGRLAVVLMPAGSPLWLALATLAFPAGLLAVVGHEIVAGRNWRNLKVLAAVAVLAGAQGLFHVEVARDGHTTYADHIAVAASVTLILIVGGRIVPGFTANWLRQHRPGPVPASAGVFDHACTVVAVLALGAWAALPALAGYEQAVGVLLAAAGASGLLRQLRWQPWRTLAEPLVTVLHVGYAFVPAGFLLAGASLLTEGGVAATTATHAWTIGAIGLMTLAVMTRATRGHTGRPLVADAPTVAIYAGILVAVAGRLVAAQDPMAAPAALPLAGVGWVLAFAGFVACYGTMLVGPRRAGP